MDYIQYKIRGLLGDVGEKITVSSVKVLSRIMITLLLVLFVKCVSSEISDAQGQDALEFQKNCEFNLMFFF